MKLIYEKSIPGRQGVEVPQSGVPVAVKLPPELLRDSPAAMPELTEMDVVRHFTELSRKNFGVDTGFYPLGSCTMKYNPKINEQTARFPGFSQLHPLMPQLPKGETMVQGALEVLYETGRMLSEICGMAAFTMQPLAGAHGELTGTMIMAAYHRDRGNKRKRVLIPDTAHGTNPASASIVGYKVQTIPSNSEGEMDLDLLKAAMSDDVAGVMLTVPSTLGLFSPHVKEICDIVHSYDALAYCDGANLNAMLGQCRPGDLGFDLMHVNLHKTFSTPHGGGGPGAGPVGVSAKLAPYLPTSVVRKREDGSYFLDYDLPKSVGYIAPFYGNFGIIVRAYTYMLMLGREGMTRTSENAVLNANYIRVKLQQYYDLPYARQCMHECVFSAARQAKLGVRALDIAKALIDRGYHPPTIYFPLTVPEAMMIEPTECESKETIDEFIAAMIEIAELAQTDPKAITSCPKNAPIGRPDEVKAAREPDLASLG